MRCKNCADKFKPKFFNAKYCEKEDCRNEMIRVTIENQRKLNEKKRRKEVKEKKEQLKTHSQHLKETQKVFNEFIRERDKDKSCISCKKQHNGQYHAGHYLSVGGSPELRFNEMNCNKQCAPCNLHLHGNLIKYRVNLIKKIGIEEVEKLEGKNELKHYSIQDLKDLQIHYKNKTKELKKWNN